jgi:hypothetical protein
VAESGDPRGHGNSVFVWHCDYFIKAVPDYKVIGRRAGGCSGCTVERACETGSQDRMRAQESTVPEFPL